MKKMLAKWLLPGRPVQPGSNVEKLIGRLASEFDGVSSSDLKLIARSLVVNAIKGRLVLKFHHKPSLKTRCSVPFVSFEALLDGLDDDDTDDVCGQIVRVSASGFRATKVNIDQYITWNNQFGSN
jgi:hypothetical protein